LNNIVEYIDFKRNYVYCNIYFGNIYARDRYSIPGIRSCHYCSQSLNAGRACVTAIIESSPLTQPQSDDGFTDKSNDRQRSGNLDTDFRVDNPQSNTGNRQPSRLHDPMFCSIAQGQCKNPVLPAFFIARWVDSIWVLD